MQSARTSARHVILCFNSGSSSVKFALYRLGVVEEVQLAHGAVARTARRGWRSFPPRYGDAEYHEPLSCYPRRAAVERSARPVRHRDVMQRKAIDIRPEGESRSGRQKTTQEVMRMATVDRTRLCDAPIRIRMRSRRTAAGTGSLLA